MSAMLWTLILLAITTSIVSANDSDDEVSYTFVVDTTGSMSAEIAEVRDGIKEILKKMPSKVKYFNIVPYNDPFDPSKVLKTDDKDEITKAVDKLSASGGGDCPEPGFKALLKAIEMSEKKSPIFYFSDAQPSNPSLVTDVIEKGKEKEISFFFLLTGCCSGFCNAASHLKYKDVTDKAGKRTYQLRLRKNVKYWMKLLKKITDKNKPAVIVYAPEDFDEIIEAIDKGTLPALILQQSHAAAVTAVRGLVFAAAAAATAAVWMTTKF